MTSIHNYPTVKLGDICEIKIGIYSPTNNPTYNSTNLKTNYPYITGSFTSQVSDTFSHDEEVILFVRLGEIGNVYHWKRGKFTPSSDLFVIKKYPTNKVEYKYLYLFLKANQPFIYNNLGKGTRVFSICRNDVVNLDINLPPLAIQKQIVEEYNQLEIKKTMIQNEMVNYIDSFKHSKL